MRKGARESAPEREKSNLWGPKGATRCQNGDKMEANGHPECTSNRGFSRKVPKVVWTYYLLYILSIGTLRKDHFLTLRSKQNAGLFRMVPRMPPRSRKMAPTGSKNGESEFPRAFPRVPQGAPRHPKMHPKIIEHQHLSPGLLPRVPPGCLGWPTVPKCVHFLSSPELHYLT